MTKHTELSILILCFQLNTLGTNYKREKKYIKPILFFKGKSICGCVVSCDVCTLMQFYAVICLTKKIATSYLIIIFKDLFIIRVLLICSAVLPGVLKLWYKVCSCLCKHWGLIFMRDVLNNRGLAVKNNINFHIGVICTNMYVMVGFKTKAQLCSSSLIVETYCTHI